MSTREIYVCSCQPGVFFQFNIWTSWNFWNLAILLFVLNMERYSSMIWWFIISSRDTFFSALRKIMSTMAVFSISTVLFYIGLEILSDVGWFMKLPHEFLCMVTSNSLSLKNICFLKKSARSFSPCVWAVAKSSSNLMDATSLECKVVTTVFARIKLIILKLNKAVHMILKSFFIHFQPSSLVFFVDIFICFLSVS